MFQDRRRIALVLLVVVLAGVSFVIVTSIPSVQPSDDNTTNSEPTNPLIDDGSNSKLNAQITQQEDAPYNHQYITLSGQQSRAFGDAEITQYNWTLNSEDHFGAEKTRVTGEGNVTVTLTVRDEDNGYEDTETSTIQFQNQSLSQAPDCSNHYHETTGEYSVIYGKTGDLIVEDVHDLQCIGDNPSEDYQVTSDINAGVTQAWEDEFRTIQPEFDGSLNGHNHVITGLTIDSQNRSSQSRKSQKYITEDRPVEYVLGTGLFEKTNPDAQVQNLTIEEASIRGYSSSGILIADNEGTVANVSVSGTVTSAYGDSHFESGRLGGLIGRNVGRIEDSEAHVKVEDDGGGGHGGLVGSNENDGVIVRSFATGNITGGSSVGGLVGSAPNTGGSINNSYATGSVEVVGASNRPETRAGGLIGTNYHEIRNSYATGRVDADADNRGGIAGENYQDTGTAENVYWNVESTGVESSGFVFVDDEQAGLTTEEMTGESARQNMNGFDFNNMWQTVSEDYPQLRQP